MTPLDTRIIRYLAACPPAISGQHGHTQTFYVACKLYHGFDLTEDEVFHYLKTYYNQRCTPEWPDDALARKAKQAALAKKHKGERGHLIKGNGAGFQKSDLEKPIQVVHKLDPATAIEKFLRGRHCAEADVYEASPIKPLDDWTQDGILLVGNLFQPGEIVNFVTTFKPYTRQSDGKVKANPDGVGESVERDELLACWELSGMPVSDAGGWLRMNPVDGVGVKDANITSFRMALLEFDSIPLDLQLSFLARLPLPIAAILTSGGKSVHAWVRVDAEDAGDYEDSVLRIREVVAPYGVDRSNKNPSRLSRLPGVRRVMGAEGDDRQRILYLNPAPQQKAIL